MKLKRYPKYKPSGVDWLGDVPEHWDVKRLKHSFDLNTRRANTRDNPIALENIESWTGKYLDTESEFDGEGFCFQRGDVLFGKLRPYLAKVHLAQTAGEAIGDLFVLHPKRSIIGKYAAYLMRTRNYIDVIDGSTYGAKMPRASWDFMGSLPFLCPTISEQNAITEYLDLETSRIDDLIAKKERFIDLLKEKRTALISRAVTKGLNPNVRLKQSKVEWLGDVPEKWDMQPLFMLCFEVKIRNIGMAEDNLLSLSYGKIVRKDIDSDFGLLPESFDTYQIVDTGDIVLRLTDLQNDQRSLRVGFVKEKGIITSAYVNLRARKFFNSSYLFYYLYNLDIQKIFYNYGGGVRQSMRFEDLKRLRVTVPSYAEQQAITKYLDHETGNIDALIAKVDQAIEKLKEYRTAIISAVVTGKFDLRERIAA